MIFNALKFHTQGSSSMKNYLLILKIPLLFINYSFSRLFDLISFPTFRFLTNVLIVVDAEISYCCRKIYFFRYTFRFLVICT